jgi:hypothetical protein
VGVRALVVGERECLEESEKELGFSAFHRGAVKGSNGTLYPNNI